MNKYENKLADDFIKQDEKEMAYNFCQTEIMTSIKDYVDIIYLGKKDIEYTTVSDDVKRKFEEISESLKRLINVLKRIYERKTSEEMIIDFTYNKIITRRI